MGRGRRPPPLAILEQAFAEEDLAKALELDGELPRVYVEEALLAPAAGFLRRPGKVFRGRLVEISWRLVKPQAPVPAELVGIVELLHAGSLIVDDVQDGSSHRRGEPALHRQVGMPLAVNTGNWLYFWSLERIASLGLEPETEVALRRSVNRTLHLCHFGQALDLSCHLPAIAQEHVAQLARAIGSLKTGQLMKLAATVGPIVAGGSPAQIDAIGRFGMRLGVGLQMLDDLGNLYERGDPTRRYEDLRNARVTWPWARLAGQLASQAFSDLQVLAGRVHSGERAAADLAEGMRARLVGNERAEARATLEKALDALAHQLGPDADMAPMRAIVAALEVGYG